MSDKVLKGNDIYLWGTALLFKKEVIEKIGLLNNLLFAYWEDTDYSLRVLRAGYKNAVCNDARIFHKSEFEVKGGSKGSHFYYFMQRNRLLLADYHVKGKLDRYRIKVRCIAEAAYFLKRCPTEMIGVVSLGLWHGLIGVTGMMKEAPAVPKVFLKMLLILSNLRPIFISDVICLDLTSVLNKIIKKLHNTRLRICI